jgi:hypothetical protein
MCPSVDWAGCPANALPPIKVDRSLAFTRPMTAKAHEYWLSVRGTRAMPTRKDISPQSMRTLVKHVALVEVRRDEAGKPDYFIRVAGGKIEDVFGSVTGHRLSDFLPPKIEERWRQILDAGLEAAGPLRATSRVAFSGKTWLKSEIFLAPLGEAGRIEMLFVAVELWPIE